MEQKSNQFVERADNPYGKIRRTYLLPAYLLVSALLIVGFIAASVPDDQPGILGISCLIFWAIVTILTLAVIPFFRKKELAGELSQFSFDWQSLPNRNAYFYHGKKNYVRFFPTHLSHNDVVYSYDRVRFSILTYNYKQHVLIYLHYAFGDGRWRVPLTAEMIHMIYQFNLELENPEDLDFIIKHSEEAFHKIYTSGSIHGIRHYLDQPPYLFE